MAQRRGTFMQGILAGMQAYQRTSAGFRQAESQRLQIENQRRQGQMLQRQYEDYQTPETPEEQRKAKLEMWKEQQSYKETPAEKREIAWEEWKRRKDYGAGGDGAKMIDIKRANEIVEAMIMDFKDTTGMGDVWPTMVPANIRDMATALVKSGQIGRAKGYLYSNYVFSTPEAKKKIKGAMKALGADVKYDDLVSVFTGMQAGISPTGDDERLVKIGNALREHPKLKEMFAEVASMGNDGIPFEDISPYIEEATDLLYPGGREPAAWAGWLVKLGSSVANLREYTPRTTPYTEPEPTGMGAKFPGGYSPTEGMDESTAMWGALKKGVAVVKDWAKQQGRTLFDPDPEAMEAPGEMAPEVPIDTMQAQPTPEPEIVQQGTPRYDELINRIQAENPKEEALKRNFEIQSRR